MRAKVEFLALGTRKLTLAGSGAAASGACSRSTSSTGAALDDAIRVRVQNGLLTPFIAVFTRGSRHVSLEGCFLAAVKACGKDAVLSHFSAAALWRLLEWDYRDPEVTAQNARKHEGIRTHKSQTIKRTFHKGIPVTTPLQTLIDLSSMLPYKQLRRAVNEALNQRLVRPHELVTTNHRGASN